MKKRIYSINLIISIFVTLITLAACTSKTTSNKNPSVPQTTKVQDKAVDKDKEIQVVDNSKQDNNLIYKSKLGFELIFPESWIGKYIINEKNGGVDILHKYNNRTAMLFSITTESQNDWNNWASTPEKEANLPVKKIGEKDGFVYVYYVNEQFPYMDNNEEEKKAKKEYTELFDEIEIVINSFKFI